MKIIQISNGDIPPVKYGGTQRVVAWLTKGLLKLGHEVTLITGGNTKIIHPNLKLIKLPLPLHKLREKYGEDEIRKYLPNKFDIVHLHYNPKIEPEFPYVLTFHWLGKSQKEFTDNILRNTIFVSKKHALNNKRNTFVYHGLDPSEYKFSFNKSKKFLFLSKVSYKPKNVKLAIKLAKKMKFRLDIAGGWRFSLSRYLKFHGMVGGNKKYDLLKRSKALIFPTQCEEPFGLVSIEALASGTPVISSEYGAMPEIIENGVVGYRCKSFEDYRNSINNIDKIDPFECKQFVINNFNYIDMAKNYIKQYKSIIKNNVLIPNIGGNHE
jgi:glycosyltransferase involved in cell wall biosynthesis